jgi:hexosaminidase
MRALETFSQLVAFDFDAGIYSIRQTPISVQDAPRFPHRGLMIDTSRHYQPLPALRALIDSLPYAKLNVLHWHVSDTQSFPLEVRSHPRLWTAAFTPAERYTQADVAAVVEYARARGVRVMVEFDMPGHAQSWCVGYPEVCPSSTCTTPLNVARNATFDFVATLLAEMTGGRRSQPNAPSGLFPDTFLHLGGDEVNTTCWGKSPEIAAWMAAHNLTEDGAYAYFVGRASDIAIAQGRRPVQVWF